MLKPVFSSFRSCCSVYLTLLASFPSSNVVNEFPTCTMFADDIVLLSNEIEQAQIFFKKVERETMKVVLHVNSEKTKFLALNQRVAPEIITADGTNIECVDDYKYLGSWIGSTEKDISIRKALAWKASNKLSQIWKSSLRRHFKIRVFKATVEPILLYGYETWMLTNSLEKQLDGCYTRML